MEATGYKTHRHREPLRATAGGCEACAPNLRAKA